MTRTPPLDSAAAVPVVATAPAVMKVAASSGALSARIHRGACLCMGSPLSRGHGPHTTARHHKPSCQQRARRRPLISGSAPSGVRNLEHSSENVAVTVTARTVNGQPPAVMSTWNACGTPEFGTPLGSTDRDAVDIRRPERTERCSVCRTVQATPRPPGPTVTPLAVPPTRGGAPAWGRGGSRLCGGFSRRAGRSG